MKHPVSVAELLELHRLGEYYLKWAATPFALSESDLQELQEISDRYHINHSSALFSFQRQYQREMVGNIEQTIDEAIEAIPGLAEALKMVPTTPMRPERSPAAEWAELRIRRQNGEAIDLDRAWELAIILGHDLESFYREHIKGGVTKLWPGEAFWFENKARELGVQIFEMSVQQIRMPLRHQEPLHPMERKFLQGAMDSVASPDATELREALEEQVHEDNAVDRESAKDHAAELRDERFGLGGDDDREIEILRDIANVDELTEEESARLTELAERKQLAQDAAWNEHKKPFVGSVPIPSGVVQDAITTGHIQKIK